MSLSHVKIILFDVDGTLTEEVSWLKLTEALGADPHRHQTIFDAFTRHELSYEDAKRKLIQLWKDTGKAKRETLRDIFMHWDFKDDAVETLNYLKEKYTVLLISGSFDLYIETIAKKLGIETWFANTTFVWNDNGELVDFHYERDQAKKKVEQLQAYLDQTHHAIEECLVIGDGDSDLGLFKLLPHSIAVNAQPYPELEKLAWKKVQHLSEIKTLL